MNHEQRKRQFNVNIFSNVSRNFPKLIEESIHVQETFTIPSNMQNKETLLKVMEKVQVRYKGRAFRVTANFSTHFSSPER